MVSTQIDASREQAVITLTDGDNGNLLRMEDVQQLREDLRRIEDSDVKLVLVRQEGRDFCRGRKREKSGPQDFKALAETVEQWRALSAVTVAVASGSCRGFGVGLFALADISIASEETSFAFPEIRNGRAPTIVASWLFSRVPFKQGLHLLLTGREFTAAEAVGYGLATFAVPEAALQEAVTQTLEGLQETSSVALRECKAFAKAVSAGGADPQSRVLLATNALIKQVHLAGGA